MHGAVTGYLDVAYRELDFGVTLISVSSCNAFIPRTVTNSPFTTSCSSATGSTWTSFWLKDESLEDRANLPDPDMLALEIAEELRNWKLRWSSLQRPQRT
jgi:hypothetical protein